MRDVTAVLGGVTYRGFEKNVPPGVAGPGEAQQVILFTTRHHRTYQVAYSVLMNRPTTALNTLQAQRILRSITLQ